METTHTFEWDQDKAEANVAKHGIDFPTATYVFFDPDGTDYPDSRANYGEERRTFLGTFDGRLYSVTYTMRGGVTRIISARLASRRERRIHHG